MNSKDILKKIPDFDDMLGIIDNITELQRRKLVLDVEIKNAESDVVREVTTNPDYFQSGKQPSMSYIDATYKHRGVKDEIIPMRMELANVVADLDRLRNRLDAFKTLLEIWRTLSANERKAVI